jgi:prepilin-type N-terminal cleavage/methylation domain-containing protein/prepilin-type processing-associated H-X9-DG protein
MPEPVLFPAPALCPRPQRASGFTLIELLVVIAIVAILAAILFPVFAQAREKARQSSCMSNLKQLGTAALAYNQDFDEMYPMAYYLSPTGNTTPNQTQLSWAGLIYPYAKTEGIFRCPSEADLTAVTPGTFTTGTPNGFTVTYAYNYYIGGNNSAGSAARATQSLPVVQNPSNLVMITDSGAGPHPNYNPATRPPEEWKTYRSTTIPTSGPWGGMASLRGRTPWVLVMAGSTLAAPSDSPADCGAPRPRHNGVTNVLWADGHVKSSKVQSFYVLYHQSVVNKPTDGSPYLGTAGWSPCLDPFFGCSDRFKWQ